MTKEKRLQFLVVIPESAGVNYENGVMGIL
jgi:hypothetical protein